MRFLTISSLGIDHVVDNIKRWVVEWGSSKKEFQRIHVDDIWCNWKALCNLFVLSLISKPVAWGQCILPFISFDLYVSYKSLFLTNLLVAYENKNKKMLYIMLLCLALRRSTLKPSTLSRNTDIIENYQNNVKVSDFYQNNVNIFEILKNRIRNSSPNRLASFSSLLFF